MSVTPEDGKSLFEFDLGGALRTWPYDAESEQWLLYEPSGYVLTFRADGFYKHGSGKASEGEAVWLPLLSASTE